MLNNCNFPCSWGFVLYIVHITFQIMWKSIKQKLNLTLPFYQNVKYNTCGILNLFIIALKGPASKTQAQVLKLVDHSYQIE